MTNQLTPQQLLGIARVVIPEEKWILCPDGRIVADETCKVFEPLKNTERGEARLMRVVFALLEEGWHLDITRDKSLVGLEYFTAHIVKDKDYDCVGKTKAEAILSLAHEVLCN